METGPVAPFPSPTRAPEVRRRSAWFGFTLGVATTLLIVFAVWGAKSALASGAKTFTRQCDGAEITGTIAARSSLVVVQVTLFDVKGRSWTASWGDYDEEVPAARLTTYSGTNLQGVTQVLGDTDGGTRRTVVLRPAGGRACELKMHASWLW